MDKNGVVNIVPFLIAGGIVADPDPPNPHVFGPPGSGSGSISHPAPNPVPDPSIITGKNCKKKLAFYCFVTSF
jgi:hypothetical protein